MKTRMDEEFERNKLKQLTLNNRLCNDEKLDLYILPLQEKHCEPLSIGLSRT